MDHNPFAIPEDLKSEHSLTPETSGDVPSAGPLHPLSGVVAGTFLGTPMGGAMVIASHLRKQRGTDSIGSDPQRTGRIQRPCLCFATG